MNKTNHSGLLKTGRPPGARNRFGLDVKEMILHALAKRGGTQYLIKLDDGLFVKLVAAIIPRDVSHSGVISGVTVQINTNMSIGAKAQKSLETGVIADDLRNRLLVGSADE